ncbi:MAG: WecB/TagA/CpsF family glycosyltransferase [Patescibacteria group bacterium]|nr:WecB/TagA/CpsF family glycosyltransferase [Patescibacteria group bacterium]
MSLVNILGININTFTKKQALAKIQEFVVDERQHQIVTPNAEIILEAIGRDEELFYILNKADLAVLDGSGPQFAALAMGYPVERYPGADMVKDILELAAVESRRVVIFNWQGGLSSAGDIKISLQKKFPKLEIMVEDVDRGIPANLTKAKQFSPEIMFCALGAPYQEKFIFHNLPNLPSVKIGLGVGGAFDFLTGRIKRAPKILRAIGLEWLWRLIKQPKRWKRIYNAVIIFPVKFLIYYFKNIIFFK